MNYLRENFIFFFVFAVFSLCKLRASSKSKIVFFFFSSSSSKLFDELNVRITNCVRQRKKECLWSTLKFTPQTSVVLVLSLLREKTQYNIKNGCNISTFTNFSVKFILFSCLVTLDMKKRKKSEKSGLKRTQIHRDQASIETKIEKYLTWEYHHQYK